jgi:hypothetical protein
MVEAFVKRTILGMAALLLSVTICSAAGAQTPAQIAKYNRYLSNHPGVAQQLAANPGMSNVPSSSLLGYPGSSSALQAQYMQNYATYMRTHPAIAAQLAANQGMTSYPGAYPAAYPYPDPTQQLTSNPMMALIAPFLSNYSGQNYAGGYTGSMVPVYQPPYAAAPYPPSPQWGGDADYDHPHWHHHFDYPGDGHCATGGGYGPYGGGAFGPYSNGGNVPYGQAPIAQAWRHLPGNFRPVGNFNGRGSFGNPGAGHGWPSHPVAFAGQANRWHRGH